jgi:hypothetical protein
VVRRVEERHPGDFERHGGTVLDDHDSVTPHEPGAAGTDDNTTGTADTDTHTNTHTNTHARAHGAPGTNYAPADEPTTAHSEPNHSDHQYATHHDGPQWRRSELLARLGAGATQGNGRGGI